VQAMQQEEDEAMARIERGRSTRSAVLEPFGQQRNAAASTGDGAEWRFAASPAAVSSSAPADRKLGAHVDSAEPPPRADGPMARTSTEDPALAVRSASPALAVRSACPAGAGRCDLPRRRGRCDLPRRRWRCDLPRRHWPVRSASPARAGAICLAGTGRCDLPASPALAGVDRCVASRHRARTGGAIDCDACLLRCTARLAARLHLTTGRWNIHG
jgi:hypothetical protein